MIAVLQVSDAHLSPRNGLFRGNLELVRRQAEAAPPALVVATGDLSQDGADREEDLEQYPTGWNHPVGFLALENLTSRAAYVRSAEPLRGSIRSDAALALAAALHRAFPAPLLALPGNHDIGSDARLMRRQPVDDARLARWRGHLGPGRGLVDMGGWRVVGLNSEVMGTGHPEEAAQAAFIAAAAAGAGDRRIALFLHRPPFLADPAEPGFSMWAVAPEGRAALAPLLDHPGLRRVASGHIHIHHRVARGAARHVWAPALSFVLREEDQPGLPGERRCGALLHRLLDDRVETEVLAPAGLESPLAHEIRDQTCPE